MEFLETMKLLWEGFTVSLQLFSLTLIFALPFGLIVALLNLSKFKPLSYLIKVLVWIVRGTPLMLQIIIIFYGFPKIGIKVPRMTSAVITFAINYGIYFSEIFRGGIQTISNGQNEACKVLGLTKFQTFYHIILPQVIKRIIPPMSNEWLTLVKDTALIRVISLVEIIAISEMLVSKLSTITPLLLTGIFYLAFNGLLTLIFSYVEKRFNYYK